MAKSSNRKQALIETALKKIETRNVSRDKKGTARKSLNEAKNWRFEDFLAKEDVEALKRLKGEET